MRILRTYTLIAAVLGMTFGSATAFAETQCLEGKTAAGTCVDATLGSMMRQNVRVFTQPRLSYSGPAVAPSADRQYEGLRGWGQGLKRETYGPCIANFCP